MMAGKHQNGGLISILALVWRATYSNSDRDMGNCISILTLVWRATAVICILSKTA